VFVVFISPQYYHFNIYYILKYNKYLYDKI